MNSEDRPLHEKFKSGFKLCFRNNNPIISRCGILRALEKLKKNMIDEIKIITKYEHNNTWLVILNDKADCTDVIEKNIIVQENENNYLATIRPLNEQYVYRRYKLVWNPFEDGKMIKEIFEKIDKRIEVREIDFERCRDKGLEKIYNGNTMILIRVKKEIKEEIIIKDGAIEVVGTKMFLSRVGGPVRCHKCGEQGHYFSECKLSEDSYKSRLMGLRMVRQEEERERELERNEKGKMEKDEQEKGKADKEKMEKGGLSGGYGMEQNYFRANGDVERAGSKEEGEAEKDGDGEQKNKKYKSATEKKELEQNMAIDYYFGR